jgi:hypothetical protein
MKLTRNHLTSFLLLGATFFHCNLSAKLVAWYPLDESPSTDPVVTENIAGNDATLIGYDADPAFSYVARGASSARPNLGLAYDFVREAAAGGGLNLGNAAAVQPTDQFTISFFFQPQFLNAFDRFFETLVGNSNDLHGMRIDMAGTGSQVRVLVRSASGANSQFTHPTTLKTDGTWYFFAFRYDTTRDGTDPFQLTVIEMSGDPIDEAAITAATSGIATLNTGIMNSPHAGNSLVAVELESAGNANNFDGLIDEFAFFDNSDGNGVLSDSQLLDIYRFGPSGVELISALSSDRNSVSPSNPATLSWTVDPSLETLVLDDGNGNTTDLLPLTNGTTGSLSVAPTETTTYTLRGAKGDAANVWTIKIVSGAAPEISLFNSSSALVEAGSAVDLTWSVAGAESLTLNPGDIDVIGQTTISVTPDQTTTYTLTATNGFGSTSAEVEVTLLSGPIPVHRHVASSIGNTEILWADLIGNRSWTLTGGVLANPLATPSPQTNISASYTTGGGANGASAGAFQYPQFSAEIWFRPGGLTANHEVLYETGGGQNGLSALITDTHLRVLGSEGDVRNLDLTLPLAGLNLDDFLQLVLTNDADTDSVTVSLRDTYGNVLTSSESAAVTLGGNGAGLFTWASGAVAAAEINLGGRTEAAGTSPEGLTGFAGEIAILNIYDQVLDEGAIQSAFDRVASVTSGPSGLMITDVLFDDSNDELTLTWNSINGQSYLVEFSTSLKSDEWFELAGPFSATSEQTTQTLNIPPNRPEFFVRVVRDQP